MGPVTLFRDGTAPRTLHSTRMDWEATAPARIEHSTFGAIVSSGMISDFDLIGGDLCIFVYGAAFDDGGTVKFCGQTASRKSELKIISSRSLKEFNLHSQKRADWLVQIAIASYQITGMH
jgi:hypothetical protein